MAGQRDAIFSSAPPGRRSSARRSGTDVAGAFVSGTPVSANRCRISGATTRARRPALRHPLRPSASTIASRRGSRSRRRPMCRGVLLPAPAGRSWWTAPSRRRRPGGLRSRRGLHGHRRSSPSAGRDVTLDSSASRDAEGPIASRAWDLDGDGTFETPGEGPTLRTQFATAGTRTVGFRVVDSAGTGATVSKEVVVKEPAGPAVAVYVVARPGRPQPTHELRRLGHAGPRRRRPHPVRLGLRRRDGRGHRERPARHVRVRDRRRRTRSRSA